MAIALDTLAYAKRLREAGFSEEQAQGQAEALAAAMSDTLATKQDLNELKGQLEYLERHFDTRLAELERRVEIRFGEQTARLTARLGGIMVAGIGALSAVVKLL